MTEITQRLARRIARDFPDPRLARDVGAMVADASDSERVQAAAVIWARGDMSRLRDVLELTNVDWRDTLVRAGLENDDWRARLDQELGADA